MSSLAGLRQQLLSAVAREVAARGAAQEMAALLKEQQAKLTKLAEARREMHAQMQATACRFASSCASRSSSA